MIILRIALPVPLFNLFDYLPSSDTQKPVIGTRVYVSFGNRKIIGVLVNIQDSSNFPLSHLKRIDSMLDQHSLFTPALWDTLLWAAQYYHYPIGKVLNYALPVLLRQGKPTQINLSWKWMINKTGRSIIVENVKLTPREQRALIKLRRQPIFSHQIKEQSFTEKTLQSLYNKGFCDVCKQDSQPVDWSTNYTVKNHLQKLNKDQILAINMILNKSNCYTAWLLTGNIGSEKNEVYFNIIEAILARGKQALVLVPEINSTSKIITLFYKRFNVPIDILHSALKNKARLNVWLRARTGESAIIIGTRSALFTPMIRLGIIIIDDEHDNSYKQQKGWCYHARDLAVFRAQSENIPIIMISATPALESLYNVHNNKYYHLKLSKNNNIKSTLQQFVTLSGQRTQGTLTSKLLSKINQHVQENNQVLLFLNRRGFSPIFRCHNCNWIARCQKCDNCYTLHQNNYYLCCHYCNDKIQLLNNCPNCKSIHLTSIGIGTEQLEQQLHNFFPNIPISRIDSDTINYKGALEHYLAKIKLGGARILIGTQILIKDHYFPDVTLILLLNIDSILFSTDFRAVENFAQLYTQIINCTGNNDKKREILLQTNHPEHLLLKILLQKGYLAFAEKVLVERQLVQLPPWTSHAIFRAEDINNHYAVNFLIQLRNLLEKSPFKDEFTWLMGPLPSLIHKRSGRWRWQLLLRHQSRKCLQQLLKNSLPLVKSLNLSRMVKWSLDIDPVEN